MDLHTKQSGWHFLTHPLFCLVKKSIRGSSVCIDCIKSCVFFFFFKRKKSDAKCFHWFPLFFFTDFLFPPFYYGCTVSVLFHLFFQNHVPTPPFLSLFFAWSLFSKGLHTKQPFLAASGLCEEEIWPRVGSGDLFPRETDYFFMINVILCFLSTGIEGMSWIKKISTCPYYQKMQTKIKPVRCTYQTNFY